MLIADGDGGAEVYSTATKYAQARLLFDECHNMIKQSPVSESENLTFTISPLCRSCSHFPAIQTVWTD